MSDNIEFETEAYGGMGGSEAIQSQEATADSAYLSGAPCSNGDCANTANPAEEAWVKLVSAVPVAGQAAYLKCVATGTAVPSQEEVQNMVGQIRPTDPDKYALQTLAEKWANLRRDFADNPESAVAAILRSKLTELSNGWQGDDFDGFSVQMEAVFATCDQFSDDIGDDSSGMVGLLRQKSAEIYALQGSESGELPYPAPQYWTEDEMSLFSDGKIHVRAPFTDGDCDIAEGCSFAGTATTDEAMELGGFDSEYTDELNQYQTDQTEYHYNRLRAEKLQELENEQTSTDPTSTEPVTLTAAEESTLRTEAERLATEDANDRAAQDYDEGSQDYQARAQEQNDTVTARWEDAETSASDFHPTVQPARDTTFRDSASDLDGSGYSPPGGADYNGAPTGSGTGGLTPPDSTGNFGGGAGGGGGFSGGGDFGGGPGGSGGGSGLDADNPWNADAGDDPDDLSGGLASGSTLAPTGTGPGTTGGFGGGTNPGGFGAGGASTGAGGGMFGAGSGAGGRTGGAGGGMGGGKSGTGTGGKAGAMAGARGGASTMMGGGGRGAGGGSGEDNEARETWLHEDEDIWGLARFDDDNDPLA